MNDIHFYLTIFFSAAIFVLLVTENLVELKSSHTDKMFFKESNNKNRIKLDNKNL